MRNSKHLSKKLFRRGLSLLLSLCMVASLFVGAATFPAFAQGSEPEPGQTALAAATQEDFQQETGEAAVTETRAEIKARLLRQARNGWDPYSATGLSMDEFYALMELFQEGALPLEEEDPTVTEVPDDGETNTDDPAIEGPAFDGPTFDVPETNEPTFDGSTIIGDPGTEEPGTDEPGINDPTPAQPTDAMFIPRGLFLFSGLVPEGTQAQAKDEDGNLLWEDKDQKVPKMEDVSSRPGTYTVYDEDGEVQSKTTYGAPLEYDNINGHDNPGIDDYDPGYPNGLDPYGAYTRPPRDWPGIALGEGMEAQVTVLGVNAGDPTISEKCNVDQSLFLEYKDVYVREVTAQNSDVIVLGAIQQPNSGEWVYYYISKEGQINEVSASTLLEGQKFVIRYSPREHTISYQIRLRADEYFEGMDLWGYTLTRDPDPYFGDTYYDKFSSKDKDHPGYQEAYKEKFGTDKEPDIADWVRQLPRLEDPTQRDDLAKAIFGDAFPAATDEGRYAFTATAPDGYTLAFYLSDSMGDTTGTWENGQAMLVTPEGFDGRPGKYTSVNQGWALGMEPKYVYNKEDHKLMPDDTEGPQELITTGTFYNNDVDKDRIVVAVLRQKETLPTFNAFDLLNGTDKNGNSTVNDYVNGRGTSAVHTVKAINRETGLEESILYDYEDLYLWATGGDSKYDYFEDNRSMGGASKQNLQAGNIATIDSWGWNGNNKYNDAVFHTMTPVTDENGVTTYSYQWTFQTNSGGSKFLLDTLEINRTGIVIPFLAKDSIAGGEKAPDPDRDPDDPDDMGGIGTWFAKTRLPDGAVILVEYLMLFNGDEQRVYRISVTGAKNNITVTHMNLFQFGSGAPEIAVYQLDGVTGATDKGSNIRKTAIQYCRDGDHTWSGNRNRGEVLVEADGDGTDFKVGDTSVGGANIRFKLASGYSSPAYLLERRDGTVIDGQASISRFDPGSDNYTELNRSDQNPVVPYISDGSDPYMIYFGSLKEDQKEALEGYKNQKGDLIKDDDPIPVDIEGNLLYYYDGGERKIFTDWTVLRVYDDGSLAPELRDSDGTALDKDQVIARKGEYVFRFGGWKEITKSENGKEVKYTVPSEPLKSQYIYSGGDGWYYIKLTGHQNIPTEKFALLTVVAFPTRYVIRYKPSEIPEYKLADGTVIEAHDPEGMPVITHNDNCPTFFQQEQDETNNRPMEQFDDNGGDFYDIVTYSDVAITYTRPYDPEGYYNFVDWVLVDEYDNPVKMNVIGNNGEWETDDEGNYVTKEFHIASGSFSITENDLAGFAIFNSDLGAVDDDIYVLRLMPTWDPLDKPYHYKVALNWVDAQGNLHAEYFDDESEGSLWQRILTNHEETGDGLPVKILTNAEPFQNWIAQHPTYAFWDDVNNIAGTVEEATPKVRDALKKYFDDQEGLLQEDEASWNAKYDAALEAILNRDRKYDDDDEKRNQYYKEGDDFAPLGNYTYVTYEDNGTIAIWMYEDKGGLVFHKSVDAEPFIPDDEFYFTVNQVTAGLRQEDCLNGTYKAYPETVYDEMTGKERKVKDSDAWLVQFVNGNIVNIVKNDGSSWPRVPVTYFTVRNGEGIQLYVPGGEYTITELGSKSGGSYRTEVTRVDAETGYELAPKTDWNLPADYQWLKGDGKTHGGSNQVSATVKFMVGEHDVARVINFSNQTSAVSAENLVIGPYQGETLGYEVTLILSADADPLTDRDEKGNTYYYFNFNLYDVAYPEGTEAKYKDEYLIDPEIVPPSFKNEEWLESEDYQKWWIWHTWRPDGTLSNVATGRLVVEKDTSYTGGGVQWVATGLLTPVYNVAGNLDYWKDSTYSGSGVIGLKSGQRFYVVCTVPGQGDDINYIITESDTQGYDAPGGGRPRVRNGKAMAAELAYELFKNTKLAGLPRTGGMGDGVFRVAGLTFLASGLGLMCVNRKGRRRAEAEPSVPAKRR